MSVLWWVVLTLYLLGGLLAMLGLGEVTWRAQSRLQMLNEGLAAVEAINADVESQHAARGDVLDEEYQRISHEGQAKKDVVLKSTTTWETEEYSREYAERDFLQHLSRPAWLAGFGILLATAGSVLSLWLR